MTPLPQFGWTRCNPPGDYRIALTRRDFSDLNGLKPTHTLVKRVAENLTGEEDSKPCFALLTNTLSLLGTPQRVKAFEATLFRDVIAYLQAHHPTAVPPLELDQQGWERAETVFPDAIRDGQSGYVLADGSHKKPLEGYGSVPVQDEKTGKTLQASSYKALHTDSQFARIFSLCYGPCQNIRGGYPRVADVRQYRRDNRLDVDDVSGPSHIGIREEHMKKLMDDYAIELRGFNVTTDMPILFLNNMIEQGVLHGAVRPSRIDKTKPATRPIQGSTFYYFKRVQAD